MNRNVTQIASLLLCGGLLVGCGASTAQSSQKSRHPELQQAAIAPASKAVGSAAYGFEQVMAARTIDGSVLTRDSRAIAMVFFASWCGHCRRELGVLSELRTRYPGLRIIGLNAYEDFRDLSDQERLRAYIDENAPWLEEIVSADDAMREDFGKIPKIPSLFIYTSSGEVVAEFRRNKSRIPSPEEVEQAVVQAIGAPAIQ